MKTVIFASVVFTLCIAAVFGNCIYITATTESLLNILENKDGSHKNLGEIIEDFSEEWDKKRFIIGLSVNGIDIDEVNKAIVRAREQAENSDMDVTEVTLSELKELVRAIAEDEKFSVEGIL